MLINVSYIKSLCFTSLSYNIQLHINYILQLVGSPQQLVPITAVPTKLRHTT